MGALPPFSLAARPCLVSPLPSTQVALGDLLALSHQDLGDRRSYPRLPWTFEELVGTRLSQPLHWRARHRHSPWGRAHGAWVAAPSNHGRALRAARMDRFPRPLLGPSFVIEHWVRVDHWPPADQLPWFGLELRHYRSDIASLEGQLAFLLEHWETCSCPAENRNITQQDILSTRKAVEGVLARMRQFAGRHDLEVSPDLLNSGLECMRQFTQFVLF